MTEVTPVETSSVALDNKSGGSMEMKVETNYAPVERKSTEMVTTEPKTDISSAVAEIEKPIEAKTEEKPIEAKPAEKTAEQKADELARERFNEKIRADNAERELAKLKPADKPLGEAPDINNFDTLENFLKARDEWAMAKGREEATTQSRQASEAQRNQQMQAAVNAKEQRAVAKYPDYYQVINPVAPIIGQLPLLKQFIAEREGGVEVAYQLAKNPALLDQLTRMTPFQAGEFLFGLEGRLKNPAPVLPSNAPEPIKPVGSRETVKPDLATLAHKDTNGYIALRNKQELARRRAN